MDRQSFLNNWIVIGIGYLIALIDFQLDLGVEEELLIGLIIWALLMIKIGGIFIAGKVLVGERRNKRELSVFITPFLLFMVFLEIMHFGAGIINRVDYNFLVVFGLPWFYYYHYKDDQRNNYGTYDE